MAGHWVKQPVWLVKHLSWLRGARLHVYLVARNRTNYSGAWVGWSLDELAAEAAVSPAAASRALDDLSRFGEPPRGSRVGFQYLDVSRPRGRSGPNALSVLDPPVPGELALFAGLGRRRRRCG